MTAARKKFKTFFEFSEFFKNNKNLNLGLRIVSTIDKCVEKTQAKFQVNRLSRTSEILGSIKKKRVSRKGGLKFRGV